jgi:hypothetical protein
MVFWSLARLAIGTSVLPRHLARLGRDSRIADISQIYGKTDANDAERKLSGTARIKKALMVRARLSLYLTTSAQQQRLTVVQIVNDTHGADDMNDHDEWISCSHWGMFTLGRKSSN